MLKYNQYINENISKRFDDLTSKSFSFQPGGPIDKITAKFKEGDKVIFNPYPDRKDFYIRYKGQIMKIESVYPLTRRYILRYEKEKITVACDEKEVLPVETKENEQKMEENKIFKVGEKVIFKSSPNRSYYKKHDGQLCKINFVYAPQMFEYQIITPSGSMLVASSNELRREGDPEPQEKYIENQFKTEKPKMSIVPGEHGGIKISKTSTSNDSDDLSVGQRVIVNGKEGRFLFENRKGTIIRVSPDSYQVEFDEDNSKNERKFSMLIDKDIVKPIDEPNVIILKEDDKVLCVDSISQFFNQEGTISRVWPDGDVMVNFKQSNGTTSGMVLNPEQIKVIEHSKKTFTNKTTDTTVPINITKTDIEEEDEDEDGINNTGKKVVTFKKEDLLEFSYKDFFLEEKISTKDDLLKNKEKYQKILDNKELPEFKSAFYERSLRTTEIIEQYFDFLINKVAKELPVYRTVEQIDNKDLVITKTKVRASESKEITKKYSFDQGLINYWKFKDAVIFRTI